MRNHRQQKQLSMEKEVKQTKWDQIVHQTRSSELQRSEEVGNKKLNTAAIEEQSVEKEKEQNETRAYSELWESENENWKQKTEEVSKVHKIPLHL